MSQEIQYVPLPNCRNKFLKSHAFQTLVGKGQLKDDEVWKFTFLEEDAKLDKISFSDVESVAFWDVEDMDADILYRAIGKLTNGTYFLFGATAGSGYVFIVHGFVIFSKDWSILSQKKNGDIIKYYSEFDK
jgi:hypothetical protein